MNWLIAYIAIGWCIRFGVFLAVLRRNFAPGASLAWIGITCIHPYAGLILYLFLGESRLGPGRAARHDLLLKRYAITAPVSPADNALPDLSRGMSRLAQIVGHMPIVDGNHIEFITDSAAMIDRLIAEIDAATSHVHLLYYIFASDDVGQKMRGALVRAAQRGIKCRVLVDQFASRSDFRWHGFASELKKAGIEFVAALPSSPLRRRDLRNHRKLSIIDDRIAFAGSQNLINPSYNGRRGNPWIDLSARITGPIVAEFATVFAMDWAFETEFEIPAPLPSTIPPVPAGVPMQVVPTGPVTRHENFRRLFLGAIDAARERLILTTPYFVPDEATLLSLLTAADRGVAITLILPETSDNRLAAAASSARFASLLDAGVCIYLYRPGLIHAKIVTIDSAMAIFGSANLDVRSFHLNFELSTVLYGPEPAAQLHTIQQTYIANSRQLTLAEWNTRSLISKYVDDAVSLISPLL